MPIVVNRHHFKSKALPEPNVYIGRGTPLGNPFTREEHGELAIPKYREHLWELVRRRDPAVLTALNAIGPGHHLVCSCAPRPCHGDFVLEVWEWLAGKGHWSEEE